MHIIKSFLWFKDKKSKLINVCYNIVCEDLCIEKILKRLYKLEEIYNYIIDSQNYININQRFEEVNKLIYEINEEIIKKELEKII